jgi:hypothetical protein
LKGIVVQSKKYADAIKFSVHAAHCSHSLAQEAINFADKRLNAGVLTTRAEQGHYLQGMAAVARQGKEKTGKVLDEFKDVSGKISMVSQSPQLTSRIPFDQRYPSFSSSSAQRMRKSRRIKWQVCVFYTSK